VNPFGLARWFLDKLGYWLGWSILFSLLMLLLTTVFGGSKLAVVACSFFSFWGTTSAMDYLRERMRFWD
jgi:hypothetical protein